MLKQTALHNPTKQSPR